VAGEAGRSISTIRPPPGRDDRLALPLTLNALAALLISPVSWSHHWVWCVPALVTFTALGIRHRSRLPWAAAAAALAVFAASPQFWLPHGRNAELRWAFWQQAAGSSYALLAALILLLAASAPWQHAKAACDEAGLSGRFGAGSCSGRGRPRSSRR
jgi:alpha-1,2-mannosyltransferase